MRKLSLPLAGIILGAPLMAHADMGFSPAKATLKMRNSSKSPLKAKKMQKNHRFESDNPFFEDWSKYNGAVPFDKLKVEHYLPALQAGIEEQNEIINDILQEKEPDFENTIEALEYSDRLIDKVGRISGALGNADSAYADLDDQIVRLTSEQKDKVMLNEALFAKIKQVYDKQKDDSDLSKQDQRLLETTYKRFMRSGALLSSADKKTLADLNARLAAISGPFNKNLVEANGQEFRFEAGHAALAGIPEDILKRYKDDKDGKYVFTYAKGHVMAFLTHAKSRQWREKLYNAYYTRGIGGKFNNCALLETAIKLRAERAALMDKSSSHAEFMLKDRIKNQVSDVMGLLNGAPDNSVMPLALQKLTSTTVDAKLQRRGELVELQDLLSTDIKNNQVDQADPVLKPWDWWYYEDRFKNMQGFNATEMSKYFELNNVRDAAFGVVENLWNVSFTENNDYPVYHPDVKAFDVWDGDNNDTHIGVFYTDYYARKGKQSGAWCVDLCNQCVENGNRVKPVVYNCCNFQKPLANEKCYLSMEDVTTLFHEFGHAMHAMLSNARYPSIAGFNVPQDFVEVPSQLMEHWATEEEYLSEYANNDKGENLLITNPKLYNDYKKVSTFGGHFKTLEYTAASLLDLAWHSLSTTQTPPLSDPKDAAKEKAGVDAVNAFEAKIKEQIGLNKVPIEFRYRSANFGHIFGNSYDAGYYSYMIAELYDCDAFHAFKETGDIFNSELAARLRKYIYSSGNTAEIAQQYRRFKNDPAHPDPDPIHMFRERGLKD